ncbi:transposase [Streptomyces cellulosae]
MAGLTVTGSELAEAYRANALFDAHRDDPEFGHRFLPDEARAAGEAMAERTAWRICRDDGWWSAFGKSKGRGKNAKAGPLVHDDLVRRDFTAAGPNQLWLMDITEHATDEGKLYLCAVKDVYSSRIVGYSIDARMKSSLAVRALESAVARRGQVAELHALCTDFQRLDLRGGPVDAEVAVGCQWGRLPSDFRCAERCNCADEKQNFVGERAAGGRENAGGAGLGATEPEGDGRLRGGGWTAVGCGSRHCRVRVAQQPGR